MAGGTNPIRPVRTRHTLFHPWRTWRITLLAARVPIRREKSSLAFLANCVVFNGAIRHILLARHTRGTMRADAPNKIPGRPVAIRARITGRVRSHVARCLLAKARSTRGTR